MAMKYHIGRSFEGTVLEDTCPCPKAPCGLVIAAEIVKDCAQHSLAAMKTIRQVHLEDNCPE